MLAFLFVGVSALEEPGVALFSELPAGATMQVDYRSDGCRKAQHCLFEFAMGLQPSVRVTGITWRGSRVELGTIDLSREDIQGLDRAIERYRALKPGRCTTVDSVVYKVFMGGRPVAWEKHVDATCGDQSSGGLLSFERLIWRAKARGRG